MPQNDDPEVGGSFRMHNVEDVSMEEITTRRSSFWIDRAGRRGIARREIFK